jgi:hypothetical protein
MDLQPYVEALQADLASAAAAGTPEAQSTASLLAVALEPAVRLCLLEALSAMAAEITDQTGTTQVELRMRGREPEVVVATADPAAFAAPIVPPPPGGPSSSSTSSDDEEDRGTARLTLRMPDQMKAGAEQRAAAEGLSLNAWLVRVIANALRPAPFDRPALPHDRGRRLTGFARG